LFLGLNVQFPYQKELFKKAARRGGNYFIAIHQNHDIMCIKIFWRGIMKRTNVVLDDDLVEDCIKATGIKTRKAVIDHALRELLRRENQTKILDLKGNIDWEGNLDEWRQGRN
jgi:Arc/MetJ family transcription regulator